MKLRYLGIHETYGVLLAADGRGPFSPSLGWLNKRLLPETMAEQQGKERKEQRLFAGLTLIALLADLFQLQTPFVSSSVRVTPLMPPRW